MTVSAAWFTLDSTSAEQLASAVGSPMTVTVQNHSTSVYCYVGTSTVSTGDGYRLGFVEAGGINELYVDLAPGDSLWAISTGADGSPVLSVLRTQR